MIMITITLTIIAIILAANFVIFNELQVTMHLKYKIKQRGFIENS